MQAPNYTIVPFSINAAGRRTIEQEAGMLVFLRAFDGAGALDLDAEVQIALGRTSNDFVPLTPGQKIIAKSNFWRVKWAANAGLSVNLLLSSSPADLDVDATPSKQLVTAGSLGTTIAVASVNAGVAATLLQAANTSRSALTIYNNGTASVFIGPAGVTTATGLEVVAGGSYSTETVTAAFYGIVVTGTVNCRMLEETA